MKRGKYEKVVPVTRKKHGLNTRIVTLMLALTLMLGVAVGGTIAWLTDKTEDVVNTFTVGNIDITLDETTGEDYKMVPGNIIDKDPIVTVAKGSEDCWVFIKVNESDNLDDFIEYKIDPNNWTQLLDENGDKVEGVYYTEYANRDDVNIDIKVLLENKVTVKDTVTKEMMDAIDEDKAENPKLTFTAYAVQKANVNDVQDAWTKANG